MIRQTYSEDKDESERCKAFKGTTFYDFLFNGGMLKEGKTVEQLSDNDKRIAYQRYIDALSVSVQGT